MPTNQQIQSLTVQVNGLISPTLLAAFSRTESMLKSMNASTRTQAAVMSRAYNVAFQGIDSNMRRATSQANAMHDAFGRIGELATGVGLGELLFSGFEKGVDLIKEAVGGMEEMSKKAMEASSKFELLSKGMGALIRDQGFANNLLDQLQQVAYKSPFQLTDLGGIARELTGRGMDKNQLFQSTKELGDLTAGLGGGPEILSRLSLAYGESFDEKTITKRVLNQFSQAGVPIMDALMQAFGMDPKKEAEVQRFFKMVHDKQVSFKDLDKAVFNLTHNGGLFTDGMLHFSETFQGLVTTFEDMWSRAERDMGGIINDWAGALLKFVESSGAWDDVHRWMEKLQEASRSVLTLVSGLNVSFPALGKFQDMFVAFNKWLGQFFDLVEIPNQGNVIVLNALGDEKIKMVVDKIQSMFNAIADFVTSKGVEDLAKWSAGSIMTGLENFLNDFRELIDVGEDIKNLFMHPEQAGNWTKLWDDMRKHEVGINPDENKGPVTPQENDAREKQQHYYDLINAGLPPDDANVVAAKKAWDDAKAASDASTKAVIENTSASQALADAFNNLKFMSIGSNYGLHGGMGTGSNEAFTVFGPGVPGDQPGGPTFDSGSWNKIGHIQGKAYALSGGDAAMKYAYATGHYHIKPGEPYISDKDHKRHIWHDTTGSRNPENEDIFVDKPQSSAGSSRNRNVTINYSPVFHSLVDPDHFHKLLRDHSDALARQVRDVFEGEYSRSAVV